MTKKEKIRLALPAKTHELLRFLRHHGIMLYPWGFAFLLTWKHKNNYA